jgi:hypothetical protein
MQSEARDLLIWRRQQQLVEVRRPEDVDHRLPFLWICVCRARRSENHAPGAVLLSAPMELDGLAGVFPGIARRSRDWGGHNVSSCPKDSGFLRSGRQQSDERVSRDDRHPGKDGGPESRW